MTIRCGSGRRSSCWPSTTANETGDAAARPTGSGFVSGHAGMVFRAAYDAIPILLDFVERGRWPRIRSAVLGLLGNALEYFPAAGHNRVDTPYGANVPLCCAIARHVRGRRDALLAHGAFGKQFLAEVGLHWRLAVEETALQDGGGAFAVAVLEGTPFQVPAEVEPHVPLGGQPTHTVWINALDVDASGSAYVELGPDAVPLTRSGSVLHPAECGRHEH